MKKNICLLAVLCGLTLSLYAQDEGVILKRSRIERPSSIFVGIGPSFTLGKNIGDYSAGANFEFGFTKRLNRVFSIGPSISIVSFNYDPDKTGANNAFISKDTFYDTDTGYDYWAAMYVDFKGGDLTLTSLAVNLKLNLIPVKDNSVVSVYGFAKPFLTVANRSEVTGTAYVFPIVDFDYSGSPSEDEIYLGAEYAQRIPWEAGNPQWQELDVTISDKLKEDSRVTGGIFVGPGVEFFPARKFSFYVQAAFGYTFPVSFVSTEKYKGNLLDNLDEQFPIAEEGFPAINVQFGASFNF
jgi:hypothetical protein